VLSYKAESVIADDFPEEYETWNTVYIAGNIQETGTFSYEGETLCFAGTDPDYENITYLGLNLLYYASIEENEGVQELLNDIVGVSHEKIPVRTLIPMTVEVERDKIIINIDPADVAELGLAGEEVSFNTTLAFQDIFTSRSSLLDENNLLYVQAGITEIQFQYPLLVPGILVSVFGVMTLLAAMLWARRKREEKGVQN
jgi:uncharacterized membrane protein